MNILLAYDSLSGGTKKLAENIYSYLDPKHIIDMEHVTKQEYDPDILFSKHYDIYILGSWTANRGRTAPRMKRFIGHMVNNIGKPPNVVVFGTGETQFGEEFFCGGAWRMHAFFNSSFEPLLIEQFPTSRDQQKIKSWVELFN